MTFPSWVENLDRTLPKKRKVLQKGSGAATTQRKQKGQCFPLNRGRTLQSYQLSLNHWLHKKAFLQNVTNNCLRGNPHWTYLYSFPNNIIQKIKLTEKHFSKTSHFLLSTSRSFERANSSQLTFSSLWFLRSFASQRLQNELFIDLPCITGNVKEDLNADWKLFVVFFNFVQLCMELFIILQWFTYMNSVR